MIFKRNIDTLILLLALCAFVQTAFAQQPEVLEKPAPFLEAAPESAPAEQTARAVHLQIAADVGVGLLGGELSSVFLVNPVGGVTGVSLGLSFLGDRLETGAFYQYAATTDLITHLALVTNWGAYVGVRPFGRVLQISLRAAAHLSEGLGGFIIPLVYRGGAWGWSVGPRVAFEFPVIERENFGFYMGPEFGVTYYSKTTALPSYYMISATLAFRLRF